MRLRTTRRTTTVIRAMVVTVALAPKICGPLFSSGRPAPGAGMVDMVGIGVLALRLSIPSIPHDLDSHAVDSTDSMDSMQGSGQGYMAAESCTK